MLEQAKDIIRIHFSFENFFAPLEFFSGVASLLFSVWNRRQSASSTIWGYEIAGPQTAALWTRLINLWLLDTLEKITYAWNIVSTQVQKCCYIVYAQLMETRKMVENNDNI